MAENFDINGALNELKAKIREAICRGYVTHTEIVRYTGADMETVYNVVRKMCADGQLIKTREGGIHRLAIAPAADASPADIEEVTEEAKPEKTLVDVDPPQKKRTGRQRMQFTAEQILKAASENRTCDEIARALGVGTSKFDQLMKEFRDAYYEGRRLYKENNPEKLKKTNLKARIDLDPKRVRDVAAMGKTLKESAEILGVGYSTLDFKLRKLPELKTAWEEGRRAFENTRAETGKEPENMKEQTARQTPTEPKFCANCGTEFVIESFLETELGNFCNDGCFKAFAATEIHKKIEFDQAASGDYAGGSASEKTPKCLKCGKAYTGDPMKLPDPLVCRNCRSEEILDIPPTIETAARFSHAIEHLSSKSEASRNGFDQVKNSVANAAASAVSNSAIEKTLPSLREGFNSFAVVLEPNEPTPSARSVGKIPFSSGGGILVGFDGNFFEMSKRERDILTRMADLMDDYKEGK